VFPRLKLRTAGAGESTTGKNAPHFDLMQPRHRPDPDLPRGIEVDPLLVLDDPLFDMNDPSMPNPECSIPTGTVSRR
jgi:hypothetical protein